MAQYINKSAVVAEIERLRKSNKSKEDKDYAQFELDVSCGYDMALDDIKTFLDTIEVKEVGIAIPNIDDLLEEDGIDPNSKDVKLFKECYYTALERYKEKKGIV